MNKISLSNCTSAVLAKVCSAFILTSAVAPAASVIWNGSAMDGLYLTGANWTGNAGNPPTNNDFTDTATFNNTATSTTVTLNGGRLVGAVTFTSIGWTLAGTGQLTTKTVNSSGAGINTISKELKVVSGSRAWSIGSGSQLSFSSLIQDGSGSILTLNGGGTLSLTGGIKEAFSSAANTFIINNGLLKVDTDTPYRFNGLAQTDGTVRINSMTAFFEMKTTTANAELQIVAGDIEAGMGVGGLQVTDIGGGYVRIAAIPEPSALLLGGIGALALLRRRSRR